MKKILLTLILGILLVSTISAMDWNNKLAYSEKDMKVELNNWFGLGKNYGSAELKSHSCRKSVAV